MKVKKGVIDLDNYMSKPDSRTRDQKSETGVVRDNDKKRKSTSIDISSNSVNYLNKSARETLTRYLKQSPQFKTIEKQIEVLEKNMKIYDFNGDMENANKCKEMIKDLKGKQKHFMRVLKKQSQSTDEKMELEKKLKASPIIKELQLQKKELQEEINRIRPSRYSSKIKMYRDEIGVTDFDDLVNDAYSEDIVDLNDLEGIDDDLYELPVNEAKRMYIELCNTIADLLDITPEEVNEMKPYHIKLALEDVFPAEKREELEAQKEIIDIKITNERRKIKGSNDITDIIFDIFDFQYEEQAPKEMLAASNIGYVTAIAINTCKGLGAMHVIDDAVAYGLAGLTVAINKWYGLQKISDSALTFEGFASQYVSNAIQRGLNEIMLSGGMISGSSLATMRTKRKQKFDFWLKNNPELSDLPKDMLEGLMISNSYDAVFDGVVTESSMSGEYDDGGDKDTWSNSIMDESGVGNEFENKTEFKNLINGLKSLFQMFETKVDKTTGAKIETNKKIFDDADYLIFLMNFGMKFKTNADGTTSLYTQREMGDVLEKYFMELGQRRTFSQEAISARLSKIINKLKMIMDENDNIRAAFEAIYYHWAANAESMEKLSNSREFLDISLGDEIFNNDNSLESYIEDVELDTLDFEISDTVGVSFLS